MKDDQRVVLTKRLLQEGLFRLLERKELDRIHVSELCTESGINRATFYRHYQQPRDILRAVRQEIIRDVQALAEKARPETNLQGWLEDLCRYFLEHADRLRVLFRTRTDEEFVETIQSICRESVARSRDRLRDHRDEDSLKLTAYCCAGGFYYVLRQWLLEPIPKSPREVAAVMVRFFSGL